MSYLGEVRTNWRYLMAAAVGLAVGYSLTLYLSGMFAPHLLKEFGWSRAQYALIGMTIFIGVFSMPIAGRLTDLYGARPMATVGVISQPLLYLVLSAQGGSFAFFFAINVVQLVIVGTTTPGMVYNRLIAQRFVNARGLALSIGATSPPVMAAICSPLLNIIIESQGWRAGYVAMAILTGIGGAIALLLMPKGAGAGQIALNQRRPVREDYPIILKSPAFQIIVAALFLCMLNLMVMSSQLKLVLADRGVSSMVGAYLISIYAGGIAIGRFVCGIALDRYRSHIIAAIAYGGPGIGMLMLGSSITDPVMLGVAVAIVGVSMGAEVDVSAFLIMRFFQTQVFSSVFGLMSVVIALSAGGGTALLSLSLKMGGGFGLFFTVAGVAALIGGSIFLLLGRVPPVSVRPHGEPIPPEAPLGERVAAS